MTGMIAPVLNGLTLISVLMLVAIGLGIIFGLMRVINLAHGEFVTLGAFTLATLQSLGGSYWMALIVAPVIGAAAGFAIERLIVRHLYARWLATILATWGLSLVIQQSLQLAFGAGHGIGVTDRDRLPLGPRVHNPALPDRVAHFRLSR